MPPTSNAGRAMAVVITAVVVAVPAIALRALCVGSACEAPAAAAARVPFCSLPDQLRSQLQAGFRDGRSPEVLAVTGGSTVQGSGVLRYRDWDESSLRVLWPSTTQLHPEEVPLVFWGAGVDPGPIEGSHTLADVAPTIADIIGLDRPYPEVRSGRPIPGVAAPDDQPRLVLQIALKGVGTDDLERLAEHRSAELRRLMEEGAATTSATAGSLPLDPAAILTTIGTGGLPSEHGITGTLVRNDEGALVEAWGPAAPFSVISTLGDDLDEVNEDRSLIGLIGSDPDRGLIGGNWYPAGDRDDVAAGAGHEYEVLAALLDSRGYGRDDVTDLLAVALPYDPGSAGGAVRELVRIAERAVGPEHLTVVLVGTGSSPRGGDPMRAPVLEDMLEAELGADLVESTAVGGLYLDQEALAETDASRQDVVDALRRLRSVENRPLLTDAFPSIAVSLARYC